MKKVTEKSFVSRIHTPHKRLGDDSVILNLDDGNYFATNETGIDIWEMLDGSASVLEIGGQIAEKFSISEKTAVADVLNFVKSLVKARLAKIKS